MLFHAETWQWTGSDWRRLHPATAPYARGAGIAALDRQRRSVVLFGGIGDLNAYNTWTWDGTNWTLESPAHQPPQRFYSAADVACAFSPRWSHWQSVLQRPERLRLSAVST